MPISVFRSERWGRAFTSCKTIQQTEHDRKFWRRQNRQENHPSTCRLRLHVNPDCLNTTDSLVAGILNMQRGCSTSEFTVRLQNEIERIAGQISRRFSQQDAADLQSNAVSYVIRLILEGRFRASEARFGDASVLRWIRTALYHHAIDGIRKRNRSLKPARVSGRAIAAVNDIRKKVSALEELVPNLSVQGWDSEADRIDRWVVILFCLRLELLKSLQNLVHHVSVGFFCELVIKYRDDMNVTEIVRELLPIGEEMLERRIKSSLPTLGELWQIVESRFEQGRPLRAKDIVNELNGYVDASKSSRLAVRNDQWYAWISRSRATLLERSSNENWKRLYEPFFGSP